MTIINVLHAADGTQLSKTEHSSYPQVYRFDSSSHEVNTIHDLFKLIKTTSDTGGCLLKGTLLHDLTNQSRAGSTSPDLQTEWLVFDLDGADYPTPADFVAELPEQFQKRSYVTQYSSSQGLKPGLRCHIFFLLESPQYPVTLKIFLKHLNLNIKKLNDNITLTATNVALSWPLDITVCQNDKLIYVAPPEYRTDDQIPDEWVTKTKYREDRVRLDTFKFDANQSGIDERIRLNGIRKDNNLTPRRSIDTKRIGSVDVLTKPGVCVVTGHKEERGYNYLNLNGGDSWGYFHKVGQNEILYNFKGEPAYLIKELLPEYYKSVGGRLPVNKTSTTGASGNENKGDDDRTIAEVTYLAFCDARTDSYYRGYYYPHEKYLQIERTQSLTKLHHFLKQHGQPIPDFIPEWTLHYDFQSDERVNEEERTINLFQKSDYMEAAQKNPNARVPILMEKLLKHLVNYNEELYEHFLNWLAFIYQFRTKTRTSWIFSGTQGTGKGVLFNNIISKILSPEYCFRTKLSTFDGEFNGFMENNLIIMIDEAQITDLRNASSAMAAIKQYITDDTVIIRKMRMDPYTARNVVSFIIFSNMNNVLQIDISDRRNNVAPRQEVPLVPSVMSLKEVDDLGSEANLQAFADFLHSYKVNKHKAHTIIKTAEHARMVSLTQDSGQELAAYFKSGDLQFFIDNQPGEEHKAELELNLRVNDTRSYKDILNDWIVAAHTGTRVHVPRLDLEVMCYYILGTHHVTRHKFSKFLGHKGIQFDKLRVKNKTTRGVKDHLFTINAGEYSAWIAENKEYDPARRIVNIKR